MSSNNVERRPGARGLGRWIKLGKGYRAPRRGGHQGGRGAVAATSFQDDVAALDRTLERVAGPSFSPATLMPAPSSLRRATRR